MIAFIVWMTGAERRIPIQYAKRVVGRKMYGGQNTHMPIKVNMSGVMPIIFASSILIDSDHRSLSFMGTSKADTSLYKALTLFSYQRRVLRHSVFPADYRVCLFLCDHPV